MKFLHAADIHLDSPLRGLSAYDDAPVDRLRTATRDALHNLVSLALDEPVDFMVIAGDLYDGNWKDFNTGLFFIREMGRLRQAGIPVYLLYGNHDAESEMTRSLELPDNVHVFSPRRAETFCIEALRVALHGRSFRVAATTDNLVPEYPAPIPGWLNIGVLHTALEGQSEHANYAPCSLPELRNKGYQYWALGHVHTHWMERGTVTIAYPGNLQGRHIRETGARGALLVTAQGTDITQVDRVETDVLRWQQLDVDVSSSRTRPEAIRQAGYALEQAVQDAPADMPLAVRVRFCGRSAAHSALIGNPRQLRHEIIAQALALAPDQLWIEKVQVASQAASTGEAEGGAIPELQVLAQAAPGDESFTRQLETEWQTLLSKIPHEVVEASPLLTALHEHPAEHLAPSVNDALALVSARVGQDLGPDRP